MKWWFFLICCWVGVLPTGGHAAAGEPLPLLQDLSTLSSIPASPDHSAWTLAEWPAAPMFAGSQRTPGGTACLQASLDRFGPPGLLPFLVLGTFPDTLPSDHLAYLYPSHNFW